MSTREPLRPEQGPPLAEALDALAGLLTGDAPFDRDAARRELDRVRGLLGETYTSDNVSETNVAVAAEVIEEEDRLGSVDVLRRRADVGNKLRSWAAAIRDVDRQQTRGGPA